MEEIITTALGYLTLAQHCDYIGEPVSQLEHALQCAYFAEQSGHSNEVILASLLHDIGHFASQTEQMTMDGLGIVHHEWIGAKLMYDLGFSSRVALLIGHHVDAKRYLAAKKKDYYQRLSPASQGTLAFQGGVMSQAEQEAFEKHPYFKAILQVRVNDEKAKEVNLTVPGLDYYRRHMREHLSKTKHVAHPVALPSYVDTTWINAFKTFSDKVARVQA